MSVYDVPSGVVADVAVLCRWLGCVVDDATRVEGDIATHVCLHSPELCQGNADAIQALADRLAAASVAGAVDSSIRVTMDVSGQVVAVVAESDVTHSIHHHASRHPHPVRAWLCVLQHV